MLGRKKMWFSDGSDNRVARKKPYGSIEIVDFLMKNGDFQVSELGLNLKMLG